MYIEITDVEEMIDDPDYSFAEDFLESIFDYWFKKGSLTEKQYDAVINIRMSVIERRWNNETSTS
jgi:hypothetical protein